MLRKVEFIQGKNTTHYSSIYISTTHIYICTYIHIHIWITSCWERSYSSGEGVLLTIPLYTYLCKQIHIHQHSHMYIYIQTNKIFIYLNIYVYKFICKSPHAEKGRIRLGKEYCSLFLYIHIFVNKYIYINTHICIYIYKQIKYSYI
jgi:hypothetical protein